MIVKHEAHHLHDFMVKLVIFKVNLVNFDHEQCTVTLIQHKQCSKNRLGTVTIVALLLMRRSCLMLTLCSRCEYTHLLTTEKNTCCSRLRCETGVSFDRLSEIKYFPCLSFCIAHCTWTACVLLFLTIICKPFLVFSLFFTLSIIPVLPGRSHSKSEKAQDLISSMFSRLSSAAEVEVTAAGLNVNSIQLFATHQLFMCFLLLDYSNQRS